MCLLNLEIRRDFPSSRRLCVQRGIQSPPRKNSAIVEFDENCIADGPFRRFMIVNAEPFVFYTINFGAEGIDTRIGGRLVSAVKGSSTSESSTRMIECLLAFRRRKSEGKKPYN
jgi:hypothetical protein